MAKVSVIIPALNEEDYIEKCLSSLKRQKGASSFEVIVVDNGSHDRTKEIARAAGVRVIEEKRRGVSRARKTGSEVASGEILMYTDADAEPPEDWIATFERYLAVHPEVLAVSGTFSFNDRTWWEDRLTRIFTTLVVGLDKMLTLGRNHLNCVNMAVRREAYERVGGFVTHLSFGEDIDLAKRLWKIGRVMNTNNKALRTVVSGRRYQWDRKTFEYLMNYPFMALTGRPWRNELAQMREHSTLAERIRGSIGVSEKK